MKKIVIYCRLSVLVVSLILILGWGCGKKPIQTLRIYAGSESKVIEPIIADFARKNDVKIEIIYGGSVDMMLDMQRTGFPYDAVLPANSMWIRLGDRDLHRVAHEASIMRSPVVLGVKMSKAKELGWIGKDVSVSDILEAVRTKQLKFGMTSATQSNSGASAYIGLLYALAGNPGMLTPEHLNDPGLQERIKEILGGVDRSSGSSGWLADMFIRKYDAMDAMFNYESMVIETNHRLIRTQKEPLYVIYPVDGQAIADSTLAFIRKADNTSREPLFIQLKDYLLTAKVQQMISEKGFRTGLIGMNPDKVNKKVYNPVWGIDLSRTISPIPWPAPDVIYDALRLYQTSFRKPSYTVYLLDVSGSMQHSGLPSLKRAMTGLLDQKYASRYFLQASDKDIVSVIPFNDQIVDGWKISGNDPKILDSLLQNIKNLKADGGTDIYLPVMKAFDLFHQEGERIKDFLPAIILMTDGKSNQGSLEQVQRHWNQLKAVFDLPPIFGVTFGSADVNQLRELANFTTGRVFDGNKQGLEKAFRNAKGYN